MTPLHMMIIIEGYVCQKPGGNINPEIWNSAAAKQARYELCEGGLIDVETYRTTPKAEAWLERALAMPMPVQKWVFEGDQE